MKPAKVIKFVVIMGLGAILSGGCGNDGGDGTNKAISSIEGSGEPTTITNTANSPAEMNVGDIYTVVFGTSTPSAIDFSGTEPGRQFVLSIGAIDAGQNSHSVQLSDESLLPEADITAIPLEKSWDDFNAPEAFEQNLRNEEAILASDKALKAAVMPATTVMGKAIGAPDAAVSVGTVESFKVLNSLSSLSSVKTVRAEAKCVGNNVVFYVDTEVASTNPGDLTSADVQSLCSNFDATLDAEYEMFGEPSDVNGDGKVAVLMTPQVNRLGAMGGGIITGFFFASDLYSSSNSNQREIIYVLVPDSGGLFGMTIPKDFAMGNLLPAVLPHEIQHAINYNNKVMVNGGSSEDNWLNEALSHFSEDILGYGKENPSRSEVYLNNTSYYGPISSGSPSLGERGASYLFLRFLYEQASNGKQFIWDLVHSENNGVANLEQSFAGTSADFDQVSEFLIRWEAAMVMSSFNLSTDPRFSYKARAKNSATGNWEGVCLSCDADDGRGTELTGIVLTQFYGVGPVSLDPTAAKFMKVTTFPQKVDLKAKEAGTYAATLVRYK